MKIAFIVPPTAAKGYKPAERSAGCTRVVYPVPNIYELTMAAVLEQDGHQIEYHDFTATDAETFEAWAQQTCTDAFVIWGVNLSIPDDVAAIETLQQHRPMAKVVMMGPGPTYFAHRYLRPGVIVVRGEPEETASELFKRLAQGGDAWTTTDGITLYVDGHLQTNPSRPPMRTLDHLPFPARHLVADKTYHNPKLKMGPYTTAVTSRNCPYRCIYCVPSSLTFAREIDFRANHGRKPPIAYRSVASVEAELAQLHAQGYRAIGFMDDNFIWNEERTLGLCAALRKYGFKWGCQARVDAITEPIARALGESGCMYVDFGVESFNDDILKDIKKGITSQQIFAAITMLKKYNVPVKLNILIGCSPLETRQTVRDTLRTAKRLDVDQVMFNIVSPFPGTEMYKLAVANGWLEGGEYRPTDVQRESILNYPHLTSRQMERALLRNNLSFFFSPRFIIKQIRRFNSWSEFVSAAKALRVKLFG